MKKHKLKNLPTSRKKCSDCGRKLKHVIFDWQQKLPWCGTCFRKLLIDTRSTIVQTKKKQKKR